VHTQADLSCEFLYSCSFDNILFCKLNKLSVNLKGNISTVKSVDNVSTEFELTTCFVDFRC